MKRRIGFLDMPFQAAVVKLVTAAVLAVQLIGFASTAHAISEETPPKTCGAHLMSGITCSGRYCDNIEPLCGGRIFNVYDWRWTQHVSEEHGGQMDCNVPNPLGRVDSPAGERAFITGISCNGSYCDNLSMECVALRDHFPSYQGCNWTDWVSEERGTVRFPHGRYAIAMKCNGRYCDNKSFLLCGARQR